ncbi:TPA: HsdR, partial [Escherichia coli]
QPELEQLATEGAEFHPCTICHKPAAIMEILAVGKNGPTVYEQTCRVCFHSERHVKFTCPECDTDQVLPVEEEDDDTFICRTCNAELSRYNLLDEENFRHVDEMMYPDGLANCAHCEPPRVSWRVFYL